MTLLQQAAAAVLLVLITLCLQCGGSAALILWIRSIPREIPEVRVFHCAALVMQTTLAVIGLHGVVILLWASCYRLLCLSSWESAFYFSASSYATVGYGDVVLPSKWRLLGPLEGMIGMLMAGVSIGLLFAAVTHLVDDKSRRRVAMRRGPVQTDNARRHGGPVNSLALLCSPRTRATKQSKLGELQLREAFAQVSSEIEACPKQ